LDDDFDHYGHELLENAEKIAEKGYTPSFNDILKMRAKTTGFGLTNIDTDEGERYQVMDVGGMRSERKKWNRHLAENNQENNTIIFCVSLCGFDETLREKADANCMLEALKVWESVLNWKAHKESNIILVFTKPDLLREKLSKSTFTSESSAFKDNPAAKKCVDVSSTIDFIKGEFLSKVKGDRHISVEIVNTLNESDTSNLSQKIVKSLKK